MPISLLDLIKCPYKKEGEYSVIFAAPAKGVLYITERSPQFISGHVRLKGNSNGRYPSKYLEMIDAIFGKQENTIEVCSGTVRGCTTVDINPEKNPTVVDNGQTLSSIANDTFDRWRSDPPYNIQAAKSMYGTELPETSKLLKAGARVIKPGSLMFLLLGAQNYQMCPKGVKRIGWIALTVVPNNEIRCLNIFLKVKTENQDRKIEDF